jgi:pimeloyl-ACP methyl ester carboxylesterase
MLENFAHMLDRWAMRMAAPSVRNNPPGSAHVAEALALLQDPNFLSPPLQAPELQFTDTREFHFNSSVTTPYAENNRVHGWLYHSRHDWRRNPTVILLHGWNGEMGYQLQFPFLARQLVRHGLNVAALELPYHGQRKPKSPQATRNFLSPDLFRTMEAIQQALADVRSLIIWLEAAGSPRVSLWGISLGAWLSGLAACVEKRVQGAVLMTPMVRMDRAIRELPFSEPIRRSLGDHSVDLNPLNLVHYQPQASPENILMVASRYDLFAPLETVEELCQGWGSTEIWRYDQGHISILLSLPVMERTVDWLENWKDRAD